MLSVHSVNIPAAAAAVVSPPPSFEEEARMNQDRCNQMLECKRQIEYWRSKLEVLENEQAAHIKLARLRLDAPTTWRSLSRTEKLEKRYILAAMESEELPAVLDDFPNSAFPPNIRMDRDILLARVARSDFARKYEEDRLFIPPKLRSDKEVILAILPKHVAVVESMACRLRDDVDIFKAVLEKAPHLPSHILQHFSERIRSNPDLMLLLCSHRDGLASMGFVCPSLRNDKTFMLKAIECCNHQGNHVCTDPSSSSSVSSSSGREAQILRYASHRLRDNHQVVLAAVQKCGLNIKHASYALRRDSQIVWAAVRQNGAAFRYCLPGPAKDSMLGDRTFVMGPLLRSAPNNVLRMLCVDRFRDDQEIVLEALACGLDWSLVPHEFQKDRAFVKEAIRRNSNLYLDLSEPMRGEYEIANGVIQVDGVDDQVLLEATERCPQILSDREAMLRIAKIWWTDVLEETLRFSPIEIRADKEIMLEAVKNDPSMYEYCSEELFDDRDIIVAAVDGSPRILNLVDHQFQEANPGVVILAIQKTARDDLWVLYDAIYDELWTNRDVAKTWLSRGGDWLVDDFPVDFESDQELLLTVAKENVTQFQNAPETLKKDKDFMLKAVALDGRVIREVDDSLRHDFDLVLLAFSGDQSALQFYANVEDFEYMVTFTNKVRTALSEFDCFTNIVMENIVQPGKPNHHGCCLSLLNQGPETVQYHFDLISSYLGLICKDEVSKWRDASMHLLSWGY
jgi:hypothetical protein